MNPNLRMCGLAGPSLAGRANLKSLFGFQGVTTLQMRYLKPLSQLVTHYLEVSSSGESLCMVRPIMYYYCRDALYNSEADLQYLH